MFRAYAGLRAFGAALIVVVGVVHVQQYASVLKDVPTVGVLFVLNGFGAGAICLLLATRARVLGAAGGVALCLGSLVSIAIAGFSNGGLFGYRETLRTAVVIAVVAEIAALVLLGLYAIRSRRSADRGPAPARAPTA